MADRGKRARLLFRMWELMESEGLSRKDARLRAKKDFASGGKSG